MNLGTGALKQMQQMQKKMQQAQEELYKKQVTGESGAGLVKITMNGKCSVISVNIDSALLSEDKELIEDLMAAAFNDAYQKITKLQEESLSVFGQGLGLPQNIKLPF